MASVALDTAKALAPLATYNDPPAFTFTLVALLKREIAKMPPLSIFILVALHELLIVITPPLDMETSLAEQFCERYIEPPDSIFAPDTPHV